MLRIEADVILTMDAARPVLRDAAAVVEGKLIHDTGDRAEMAARYPQAEPRGGPGCWLLPGLVNAHHHGGVGGGSWHKGVRDIPLERHLMRQYNWGFYDGQAPYARLNTLMLSAQLIRSGVTCVADFYYGDDSAPYLGAEHGLNAYREAGLRAVFMPAARNRFSPDNGDLQHFLTEMPPDLASQAAGLIRQAGFAAPEAFFEGWERTRRDFHEPGGRIAVGIAVDGPLRCTPEYLRALHARAAQYGAPFQMHLLETKYQRMVGTTETGGSLITYLDGLGLLDERSSFAHGIWLSEADMALLAERGASTVPNPSSNLRLFDGVAPITGLLHAGVNVALGTDSFGFSDDNDFIEEVRLATLLQRQPGITNNGLSGEQALALATRSGARALGVHGQIGSIRKGGCADLVVLDARRMLNPWISPLHDDPHEVFWRRARREDVRDVLVDGAFVLQDGALVTIDEAAVSEAMRGWLEGVWRMRGAETEGRSRLLDRLEAAVIAYFRRIESREE